MSPKILIVDDDPIQRQLLEVLAHRLGYAAETAEGGEAAVARICAAHEPSIDLVILDLVMPDLDGMGVLGRLREKKLRIPIIVQTASGSVEAAISAMRAGAVDFVVKPAGAERLQFAIKNALRLAALEEDIRSLARHASGALSLRDIAGQSEEMERVVRLGERAAKSAPPILLEGEAGVGKELVARAIQAASDRRGRPFVVAKCGGPADLVESLLFGGDKGVPGSADAKLPGKFVEAHGGVLFLDEIGELPLAAQARLLRALRDGEVDGAARRAVKIDVRPIAATKQNLIELVKAGRFREDLYYRLNVHPIMIPPLRQRRDDIEGLARRFCARFSAQEGKRLRGLGAEALSLLAAYDWPGNVRQLENAVFRGVVLAEGDELTVAEFPQIAAEVDGFDVRIPPVPPPVFALAPRETEVVRTVARDPDALALLDENGDMRRLDRLEAEAIRFALVHYRGRMSTMARKLGIGRSTLYRKMKEYGFSQDSDEPGAGAEAREDAA